MGKIKSSIITALLAAAIAVLAVFALFSWQVPGSNGVKRYNSFISNIHLGADLSGEAVAVLYPEGVITPSAYADLDDIDKDDYAEQGSVYVEKEKLNDKDLDFKGTVRQDAKILTKRMGNKGYTSYSVSVQDDYTIRVAVPTDFTYAAYTGKDNTSRTEASTAVSNAIRSLAYNGKLTLRNEEAGNSAYNNILTGITTDVNAYFKSVEQYSLAGNYAVKLNLTKEGREALYDISYSIVSNEDVSDENKSIGFFVGENQLLSLTLEEAINSDSFYITVDEANSQNYAIILNSVVKGQTLTFDYGLDDLSVTYASASLGNTAAIFLGVVMLLIIAGAIAYSVARYKKLGIVNAIIILMYSLTIVIALLLLEIQLTLAGAVTAVLGLALLCGSNFALFENVRKETKKGKTIQSAVKSGYKNMLAGILEMHVILIAAAIMLTLICIGEISACGLIFFIATVASYALYWFTRLMWYVISSLAKDKFRFCGYKREELIDD